MNMKKIATMATCMALVGAVAVGGTLALMTKDDSITNTFVVGAGFPEPDPGDLPYFYVDEAAVQMNEKTGNWTAIDPVQNRVTDDQTYGKTELHPNWKVIRDTELYKDPTFKLNTMLEGADQAPAVFVVAKLGAVPTGFTVKATEGNNWYKLTVTEGEDGKVTAQKGAKVGVGEQLDSNTYYIFESALKMGGEATETDALFDCVEVGETAVAGEANQIEVKGVAVETPFEGATLEEVNLNVIASSAYDILK